MSLRAFHLFFIAVSVVLAVFVATWAGAQYQSGGPLYFVAASATAALSGAGLAVYGAKFQRRTRNL